MERRLTKSINTLRALLGMDSCFGSTVLVLEGGSAPSGLRTASDVKRNLRHEPSYLQSIYRVEQRESFRRIKRHVSLLSQDLALGPPPITFHPYPGLYPHRGYVQAIQLCLRQWGDRGDITRTGSLSLEVVLRGRDILDKIWPNISEVALGTLEYWFMLCPQ